MHQRCRVEVCALTSGFLVTTCEVEKTLELITDNLAAQLWTTAV